MKRCGGRIMVCLCLGAITTVVVAWTCAWFVRYHGSARVYALPDGRSNHASLLVFSAFGSEYGLILARHMVEIYGITPQAGYPSDLGWSVLTQPGVVTDPVIAEEARGWPFLCLRWRFLVHRHVVWGLNLNGTRTLALAPRGPTISVRGYGDRVLPLQPLWRGMAMNIVLYSLCWGCLLRGLRAASWAARRRKGRCSRCGYDLRGEFSAGCPECGWRRDDGP